MTYEHKHRYQLMPSPNNYYVFKCPGCLTREYVYIDKKLLRDHLVLVTGSAKEFAEAAAQLVTQEVIAKKLEQEIGLAYAAIANWRPKERGPKAWLNKAAEKTADFLWQFKEALLDLFRRA